MKNIIFALVGLAVIAAGGYYVMGNMESQDSQNTEETEEVENLNEESDEEVEEQKKTPGLNDDGTFSGSIFDLAKEGAGYRCEVSQTFQEITTDGVVYVAGENVRGEFTSEVPVLGEVTSYMLAMDGKVYSWNSMTTSGFVSPQGEMSDADDPGMSGAGGSLSLQHSYSYNCAFWTPDSSLFELPDSIEFQEMGAAQ